MSDVHDPLSAVRDGYDRWARVYDHDANPLPALEAPHVRAAFGDVRGRDVLDLGCGTGRHTAWLAESGARVTAVDFSEGMLEHARRKVRAAHVRSSIARSSCQRRYGMRSTTLSNSRTATSRRHCGISRSYSNDTQATHRYARRVPWGRQFSTGIDGGMCS